MSDHNGTHVPIPPKALHVCRGSRRKLSVQKNIDAWLQRLQAHACNRYLTRHRLQTLAELLSNLESVSESGEGWSACCPAHPDSRPSLSVHAKSNGRFLIKCHRDCKFEDIVQAAGMTLTEMFDTALSTRTAIQPARSVAQVKPKVTESVSDFEVRQEIYSRNATDSVVDALASDLGVSPASLRALRIGWCVTEDCWTFPEFNGRQQLCGIVRRFRSGAKRSCKGGHRGLSRRSRIDPAVLVRERFQVDRPEALSIREASSLIDELKRGLVEVQS
jgi:hypothetical protein